MKPSVSIAFMILLAVLAALGIMDPVGDSGFQNVTGDPSVFDPKDVWDENGHRVLRGK